MIKKILLFLIGLAIGLLFIGFVKPDLFIKYETKTETIVKSDTIYIRNETTIANPKPIKIEKISDKIIEHEHTLVVNVADKVDTISFITKDTLRVDRYVFADSVDNVSYYIDIRGIDVVVDSIKVSTINTVITNEKITETTKTVVQKDKWYNKPLVIGGGGVLVGVLLVILLL